MQYASQIEHYFSGKDALSFIFECKEDHETFAREVHCSLLVKDNLSP